MKNIPVSYRIGRNPQSTEESIEENCPNCKGFGVWHDGTPVSGLTLKGNTYLVDPCPKCGRGYKLYKGIVLEEF